MPKPIVYGIPNCDSVKKARKWLDAHSIDYQFHDYKKQGITSEKLISWSDVLGWDALLNRRGTTWRKLDEAEKTDIGESKAISLMAKHTSMIKRPVIEHANGLLLGFDEVAYESSLKKT